MAPRYALFGQELRRVIGDLNQLVDVKRAIEPEIGPPTETLRDFLLDGPETTKYLPLGDVVSSKPLMGHTLYVVPGAKRFTADFYRNSAVHLFIHSSCLALSELVTGSAFDKEALRAMYDLFSHDFQLSDSAGFFAEIDLLIDLG